MNPNIIHLNKKKLIGYSCKMNFVENKTADLWRQLMPLLNEIENKISANLFSVQLYDADYNFNQFNASTQFTKWAAAEVSTFKDISANMEMLIIEEGLYAVFLHKGSNQDNSTFEYIFQKWIPTSNEYALDIRPHFEVLGKYYKNGDPSSQEEIWIPIKVKI